MTLILRVVSQNTITIAITITMNTDDNIPHTIVVVVYINMDVDGNAHTTIIGDSDIDMYIDMASTNHITSTIYVHSWHHAHESYYFRFTVAATVNVDYVVTDTEHSTDIVTRDGVHYVTHPTDITTYLMAHATITINNTITTNITITIIATRSWRDQQRNKTYEHDHNYKSNYS